MKISPTERNTYQLTFPRGELEVNLIPANGRLPTSQPCSLEWNGNLICVHDNVGITALQLKGCPPVPRICWDNREHHFWEGYSGGFEPRNTIVNDIQIHPGADERTVTISYYYIANFVKVTQSWRFAEPQDDSFITWDTTIQIQNLHKQSLKQYMAFFASYHQPGLNYYWDREGQLTECAEEFYAYPNAARQKSYQGMTASFVELVKGWGIQNPTKASVFYGQPILLSEKRPWYGNGQHVMFVDPAKCVAIVSAMNQARDYMLAPPHSDLAPQESFATCIRHFIANIRGPADVQRRWDAFIKDLAADHRTQ
jgi:hypothetical protein